VGQLLGEPKYLMVLDYGLVWIAKQPQVYGRIASECHARVKSGAHS
jgi:hypothetical protein